MRIQINGEPREFPQSSLSLAELIDTLSLAPQRIAVEVNKTIVRRSEWEKTKLNDGDHIEIVHFVGGGLRRQTADGRKQAAVKRAKLLFDPRTGVESNQVHKAREVSIHVITSNCSN